MGDDFKGGGVPLPASMTEQEVIKILRELLGDEGSDAELLSAYRSGMFQELCPDIVQYAKQKEKPVKGGSGSEPVPSVSIVKQEKNIMDNGPHTSSATVTSKGKVKVDSEKADVKTVKEKRGHSSNSESDGHKEKKKKKREHYKDGEQKREKDKDKSKSTEREKSTVKVKLEIPSSDSEDERKKTKERSKAKRMRKLKEKGSDGVRQSSSKQTGKEKAPEKERKKEPKPSTTYNSEASHISFHCWKPVLSRDHSRYAKMLDLKPMSITCLDLLDLPILFHDPQKKSKNRNSIPLTSDIELNESQVQMIRRLERDKLSWFKEKLRSQALKLKEKRARNSSNSDKGKKVKRRRIVVRIDSSSNSSALSDRPASSKKPKATGSKDRDRSGGKLTKAAKEAEARSRKLEEIRKKAESLSARGTGVLPWENKDNHEKKLKDANKQQELASQKEKKNAELARREIEKQKVAPAPSVSLQQILAPIQATNKVEGRDPRVELKIPKPPQQQPKKGPPPSPPPTEYKIEGKISVGDVPKEVAGLLLSSDVKVEFQATNKVEARDPRVELKIPKPPQQRPKQGPPTEYKIEGKISVGDVPREVARLLSSDVKVEFPVIPDSSEDLGEYTVRKIAWWLLKMERDPPDQGVFHPECHDDDDDEESVHSEEFDWPSDTSSVHGCASDPEGLDADIPQDPIKIKDPDWADEYCGEASLEAKIRRNTTNIITAEQLASMDSLKIFLRTKPGSNYSKTNFEAKCFICDEMIHGPRQLGAHIRSYYHKNKFRNYSVNMATYDENVYRPAPKKEFIAQLVGYTVNPGSTNSTVAFTEEEEHRGGNLEGLRSDSPCPVIGGDGAGNVFVHEMPIPDDISLPSIEDYDISSDESLTNVKVALRTTRKWDDRLEKKWRAWKDEEAKIVETYNKERDFFIKEPTQHPSYQDEWLKFAEKRCAELEAEGKDPENYDFRREWLAFWYKRMLEIMKEKIEEKVYARKKWLGVDKHTLRSIYNVSADATRRKKKRKLGRAELENSGSSSSRSSSDVDSSPD